MSRTEFPERIKVKRLHFAEFKCEGIVTRDDGEKVRCNATLARGRVRFDHDNPDQLGGPATFENCRALCLICDKAKYTLDAANIAKAKRREATHIGATRPAGKIRSAGFAESAEKDRTLSKTAVGQPGIARQFRTINP